MKVGRGRVCLSPYNKEFYLIGYKTPFRNSPAEGIHDDIFCNGLLIEADDKKIFLVSLDFLELEDEMVAEAKSRLSKAYGIDRDLIMMSATHNHSSIMSYHKHWHSGIFEPDYYEFVMNQLLLVCQQCFESLQPATAAYGSDIIVGFYGNRNHPGALADNEVTVITFNNSKGKAAGVIVNIAVHSTVLSAKNNLLTSELAGNICSRLEKEWGIYPLMLIGAAADSSNRHQRQGDDFTELERVAEALADRISQIRQVHPLSIDRIAYQTLSHTIYNDMVDTHQEVQHFLDSDSPLKNPGLINKCQEILQVDHFYQQLEFGVYQLGELQIYSFPGELGSAFGIQLKKASATHGCLGIVAGYTNGFHYYFLPKEEYGLSFETIGNPVPSGEPEKIIIKMIQSASLLNSQLLEERGNE